MALTQLRSGASHCSERNYGQGKPLRKRGSFKSFSAVKFSWKIIHLIKFKIISGKGVKINILDLIHNVNSQPIIFCLNVALNLAQWYQIPDFRFSHSNTQQVSDGWHLSHSYWFNKRHDYEQAAIYSRWLGSLENLNFFWFERVWVDERWSGPNTWELSNSIACWSYLVACLIAFNLFIQLLFKQSQTSCRVQFVLQSGITQFQIASLSKRHLTFKRITREDTCTMISASGTLNRNLNWKDQIRR